jgi:hypothetical protein
MMLDKQEQRVVDDIGRCGWHLLGVLAGENDPPFTVPSTNRDAIRGRSISSSCCSLYTFDCVRWEDGQRRQHGNESSPG